MYILFLFYFVAVLTSKIHTLTYKCSRICRKIDFPSFSVALFAYVCVDGAKAGPRWPPPKYPHPLLTSRRWCWCWRWSRVCPFHPESGLPPIATPLVACVPKLCVCAAFFFFGGLAGGWELRVGVLGTEKVGGRPARNKQTITNNCGNDNRILSVYMAFPPFFFGILHLGLPDFGCECFG